MSEPVVGIDLGTTYSAVAAVIDGRPRVLRNRDGSPLTPSMVGFTANGTRVVGERARLLADEAPERVAFATKRFIGQRWTPELASQARNVVPYPVVAGPSGEVRVKVGGRVLPVTQISAMILSELKLDAEAYFGRTVRRAVITVPANFDDGQRNATKEAARIAGLEVLRLVNEPTSAALAYGLTANFQGRALVFDLGGGTLDVSVLDLEKGVFEVRATGGDPLLGGEDFDQQIVQWLVAQVPEPFREAVLKDKLSMQRLRTAAEKAKRELTLSTEAPISVADLGDRASSRRLPLLETLLTQEFFATLCQPLLERSMKVCRGVLAEAKLEPAQIQSVLLVGGMTRVPMVRSQVQSYFGRAPARGVDPDQVVALGAAVHAAELAERTGSALLLDVASHSLGVGVLGGRVQRLLEKNTSIPAVAVQTFYPGKSGQREVRIPIYQGEGKRVAENTLLGELWLKDLQGSTDRQAVPIQVRFELSSEGTLSVRAIDLSTGLAETIDVEARTELSSDEAERLRQDEEMYSLTETQLDADRASEQLKRTLAHAEKLARVLAKSAEENPSPAASAAVEEVQALIAQGKHAMRGKHRDQMAEVSRRLARLALG